MNDNRYSPRRSTRGARARAHVVSLIGVTLFAFFVGAWSTGEQRVSAQSGDSSDWDSNGSVTTGSSSSSHSAVQCYPECRSGYECAQGECLPICNPGCGPGYLCSAGGSCVRMAPPVQPRPAQSWSGSPNQCLPSCRAGYVCVTGQCVSACNPVCPIGEYCTEQGQCIIGTAPAEADAGVAGPSNDQRSSSADSIVNIHADVAGLLQFGLTPTIEVGKRFSGYLRLRPLNTGLASYYLLARRHGEDFNWGLGAALGMHAFSAKQGNMRGIYGGPALEYVFVKTTQSRASTTYGTHVLIPELDLGYRWGFDSFLLGLGGRIGLSVPVAAFDHGPGSNHCVGLSDCNRSLNFLAGAVVDIGWFL
ncbi:MAG: keratin-associated protein 10-4 [Myxococcaceae bacterium]|nr:keratin-associated protein 10-4 [Myxococcaceae bacterium]